jgi:hypothetical protein
MMLRFKQGGNHPSNAEMADEKLIRHFRREQVRGRSLDVFSGLQKEHQVVESLYINPGSRCCIGAANTVPS